MGCIITGNYMCIYRTPTQLLFSLKVQTFLFSVLIKVLGIDAVTHHPISTPCAT